MTTVIADTWVRGGTVVDPARNICGAGDVLIRGNKIIEAPSGATIEAAKQIDASGHLVFPGLVDFHTHLFHGGSEIGLRPDISLVPHGITTAVDQGSAGTSNCESFFNGIVKHSTIRIFVYLHASPAGLATIRHHESVDPKCFDLPYARVLFDKYPGQLAGLKIRQSKEIVGELGLKPLEATLAMADALGCRVAVHTTNPPGEIEDLAALLRPGDVFTHMYHGTGSNIVGDDQKVRFGIRAARERGVLFDTADARTHFAFRVARAAIADHFEPDIISSDLIRQSAFERPLFGLPLVMSKYLSLGLDLVDIVRACTATPASLLGMEGQLGTLAPGAYADVAIFQMKDQTVELRDLLNDVWSCPKILVPRMTIVDGTVAYRSIEF
jgi:predicted amidohydrolase